MGGFISSLLGGTVLDQVKGVINSLHLDPAVKAQVEAEVEKARLDRESLVAQLEVQRELELARLAEANVESARQRQIAVKDKTIQILSIGIPVLFFAMLGMITFHAVPNDNKEVFYTAFGTTGAALLAIINYHFGSSSGSDRKTEILAKQVSKQASEKA